MTPFGAVALKFAGAAGAAALISVGVAGGLAQAASPNPKPGTAAAAQQTGADRHADRRVIARAVFESEADVLGLAPKTLRADLRHGQKISDLAQARGMNKAEFATRLSADLKPRLEALVDRHVITQAQADRVLDRIAKGRIPFWNGIHLPK